MFPLVFSGSLISQSRNRSYTTRILHLAQHLLAESTKDCVAIFGKGQIKATVGIVAQAIDTPEHSTPK